MLQMYGLILLGGIDWRSLSVVASKELASLERHFHIPQRHCVIRRRILDCYIKVMRHETNRLLDTLKLVWHEMH